MNRRSLIWAGMGLLAVTMTFASLAGAEDPVLDDTQPPVRLKKKIRPAKDGVPPPKSARPGKDGEAKKLVAEKKAKDGQAKKSLPKRPDQVEAERKQLVQRVLKNMRKAEERLAKNDPGRGTRDIQRDIVKDLEKLIEQVKQNPPPQGGAQQQQSNQKSSSQKSNKRQGSQKNQGNKGQSGQKAQQSNPNNKGGGGNSKSARDNKLADLFKDVWGHLPETMRQDMDAYSRAKFIPRYEMLLKEYYRSLSEQGSRK